MYAGLPRFYSDISDEVVLVASKDGKYTPFKPNAKCVTKYKVGRRKIKEFKEQKAADEIYHIEASDLYFGGKDIEDIDIPKKSVSLAYVGEDWYIAVDSNNNIIEYVQKNSINKEAAKSELEKYRGIITQRQKVEDMGIRL